MTSIQHQINAKTLEKMENAEIIWERLATFVYNTILTHLTAQMEHQCNTFQIINRLTYIGLNIAQSMVNISYIVL